METKMTTTMTRMRTNIDNKSNLIKPKKRSTDQDFVGDLAIPTNPIQDPEDFNRLGQQQLMEACILISNASKTELNTTTQFPNTAIKTKSVKL